MHAFFEFLLLPLHLRALLDELVPGLEENLVFLLLEILLELGPYFLPEPGLLQAQPDQLVVLVPAELLLLLQLEQ